MSLITAINGATAELVVAGFSYWIYTDGVGGYYVHTLVTLTNTIV